MLKRKKKLWPSKTEAFAYQQVLENRYSYLKENIFSLFSVSKNKDSH